MSRRVEWVADRIRRRYRREDAPVIQEQQAARRLYPKTDRVEPTCGSCFGSGRIDGWDFCVRCGGTGQRKAAA